MKSKVKKVADSYGGILLGLSVIIVLFSFLSKDFLSIKNVSNIILQTSIVAIISIGMTYVILLGDIDLSVGSILAISGMVLVIGLKMGISLWFMVPVTLLTSSLCGLFNGIMVTKLHLNSFIVTVATMGMFRGIAFLTSDGKSISLYEHEAFLFISNGSVGGIPFPVIILFVLVIVNHILLSSTKFGRKIYLVGGNVEAAAFSGINVGKVKLRVFILSSILCGVSGIMMASMVYSAQPNAGNGYELNAIAAVVLGGTSLMGGRGTILGTIIGALIIGCLNNGLNLLNINSFYSYILKGAVILLAVSLDVYKNRERR